MTLLYFYTVICWTCFKQLSGENWTKFCLFIYKWIGAQCYINTKDLTNLIFCKAGFHYSSTQLNAIVLHQKQFKKITFTLETTLNYEFLLKSQKFSQTPYIKLFGKISNQCKKC